VEACESEFETDDEIVEPLPDAKETMLDQHLLILSSIMVVVMKY
jgi:hypothetical protein